MSQFILLCNLVNNNIFSYELFTGEFRKRIFLKHICFEDLSLISLHFIFLTVAYAVSIKDIIFGRGAYLSTIRIAFGTGNTCKTFILHDVGCIVPNQLQGILQKVIITVNNEEQFAFR